MVHFDFDSRYQDELVVGSAMSRRDGITVSVLVHALVIGLILWAPELALFRLADDAQARQEELRRQQERRDRERARFVFVQPRLDLETLRPKPEANLSDRDRRAQAPARALEPVNPEPFSRGNSAERLEAAENAQRRGQEAEVEPDPPRPQPEEQLARVLPPADLGLRRPDRLSRSAPGALGEALRNLQRYVQNETFDNPQGGAIDPGSTIQFDTKGIEFGPWLRRFVAQVRRNWFIPHAALTFRGHVVLQFNIHKDGRITDLVIARPSDIDAFNRAAYNAILGSNPVEPLPPEYPDDRAFFTVTFYYNEPVN